MADYIDRKELLKIEKLLDNDILRASKTARIVYDQMIYDIEHIPAADVPPVKHGKWISKQLYNFRKYAVTCSNCSWVGIENYDSYYSAHEFNCCPNCGAYMDLER